MTMTTPTMNTTDFESAHYIVFGITTMIEALLFLFQAMQICCHFNPMECDQDPDIRSSIKCILRFHVAMFAITVLILCGVIVLMPIVLDICLLTVCISLVMTSLTLSLLWITMLTKHHRKMAALQMFVVSNACYFANCWMTYEVMDADTFSFKAFEVMVVAAVITNGMLWMSIRVVFGYTFEEDRHFEDERMGHNAGGYGQMEDRESLV